MAQAPATQPTQAPSSPRKIATIIVIVASALAVVVLFGFSLSHLFTGRAMPLDEKGRERSVVVSAEFLELYLDSYILRLDGERFRKTKYVNNRIELHYDYEHDGDELHTSIFFEASVEDARDRYVAQAKQLLEMARAHSDTAKPIDSRSLVQWGDEWAFTIVKDKLEVVGAYFAGRSEDRVYVFWMEGIDFQDTDVLSSVIQQRLGAMESYSPDG